MITFSDIKKLFELKLVGEIHFCVKDDVIYDDCFMGQYETCWFGLTSDGKNAYDFDSFDDLSNSKVFDGKSLIDIWDRIEILELDACEPEYMFETYYRKHFDKQ